MQSFLDPAILFFLFGILAGAVKSNLEIPPQVSRFLSLYLLMALGLKGGFALAVSGVTTEVAVTLSCALLLAIAIPALAYRVLGRVLGGFDAAAVAATYGSVSAVTFITASQVLDTRGLDYGGHMAAAMALMESPAIIMAVLLANRVRRQMSPTVDESAVGGALVASAGRAHANTVGHTLREALTDGAQLLLLGAMVVGLLTGEAGRVAMQPFTGDLFKGMLAFFLLDMGLLAARNMGGLKGQSPWLLAYAMVAPLLHAALALGLCMLTGVSAGNGALLMVLAASASYIAVPAALRHAIPEAQPAIYFGMSLGLTFPLNILVGIPLYIDVAHRLLP